MQLFVYFHLFIIVLLEFQAFCVHMCIYIHNIYKMDMKIDIKFNFSFKFRLNTILEEKKKREQKKGEIDAFSLRQIILPYSDCIFLFSSLSSPLNGNRGRIELSIKRVSILECQYFVN